MIDSCIVGETYTSGRVTVCELTLRNGYVTLGFSSCVSKENFDAEIGQKIARANARDKIWELEGYLLRERTFDNRDVVLLYNRIKRLTL